MPPMARTIDADHAAQTAQAAFRNTASQQLKRLMAEGVDGTVASSRLMDELLANRASQATSAAAASSSAQSLQDVVSRTGFSREQASKTLLLLDEIRRLRREGHSTATLIEQLHRRLRNAGQMPLSSQYDNGDQGSHLRLQLGPLPKKHKLNEEGAITTFTSAGADYFPHLTHIGVGLTTEKSDKRCRGGDDLTPMAQLKKLKLRSSSLSGDGG